MILLVVMDPFFIVEILIGVVLLGVIIKILPFLLKFLFWVLVVSLILIVVFGVSWNEVIGWAQEIYVW